MRIFDRQDWLRVNRARARIKVLVDKIGIDEFRNAGRGGARGRLGWRARFSLDRIVFDHDEEANAPAKPQESATPNGDNREFSVFVETNVQRQRQLRLLDRRGQGDARRPDPRAASRARADHA